MIATRRLIVNADDFGLSPGVNRGIIEAAVHGILTSASLMTRWPSAPEAGSYAKTNRDLSVGLHVDLGEWVFRDGDWARLYDVVSTDDAQAAAAEIYAQLAAFRQLTGRDPSHLDSHQHVHRNEPVHSIMLQLARELSVPLRDFSEQVRYCGDFYGQTGEGEPLPGALTLENLRQILAALPAGATELGCHPGYGDDLNSPYRFERVQELRVLCHPESRRVLAELGIQLSTFEDLSSL